jgi:hypothetical protein
MNLDRVITILIVALMIMGTFFASQWADPVTAKDGNGKGNTSLSLGSDTQLLAQVEQHLGEVLDDIDDEAEVKQQLYAIARNAHAIELRTSFFLGIDTGADIGRDSMAFDPQGDFEMYIATNGDMARLDTMNDALAKYDDRLKYLLSGIDPSDVDDEGSAKMELQEIHDQASSISKSAMSYLGFGSFFYGNILPCEPHQPIKIHENRDFTAANGVVGGNGTEADPYIISSWEIDSTSENGIEIKNTDAHFIIRNVCIHKFDLQALSGWYGIFMSGVENGAVETSSIHHNYIGLSITDSPGIRVE